jgi:hypothetical protein
MSAQAGRKQPRRTCTDCGESIATNHWPTHRRTVHGEHSDTCPCHSCARPIVPPFPVTPEFVRAFNHAPPHVIEIAALRTENEALRRHNEQHQTVLTAELIKQQQYKARAEDAESKLKRFKGWRVRYEINSTFRNEWVDRDMGLFSRDTARAERAHMRADPGQRYRNVRVMRVIELARAQHTRDAIEACAVTILAKLEPANAVLMQRSAKP